MDTRIDLERQTMVPIQWNTWIKIGLRAGLASVVAVLVAQAIALSIWPEAAAFKPLNSFLRSAIFTLIPALVATGVFAFLVRKNERPIATFYKIAAIILLLSFIPDYAMPDPNKTFLASSIAAFLHLVAAALTVALVVSGYRQEVQAQG